MILDQTKEREFLRLPDTTFYTLKELNNIARNITTTLRLSNTATIKKRK